MLSSDGDAHRENLLGTLIRKEGKRAGVDQPMTRPGTNLLSSSAGAAYSYNTLNQSTSIKRAGGSARSRIAIQRAASSKMR